MPTLPDRLLVVAAHPDDEVLGCGGTVAKVNAAGGSVLVLILSEGASTQYPGRPDVLDQKHREAEAALERLGGGKLVTAALPDMRMCLIPPSDVSAPIGAAIAHFQPEWIITHHAGDLNADHRVAHEATRVAGRLGAHRSVTLLAMEVPSSTEHGYEALDANLFVELDDQTLTAKCAALEQYQSEIRPFPHGRSTEAVRALATFRGYSSGSRLAEAFQLIWARA